LNQKLELQAQLHELKQKLDSRETELTESKEKVRLLDARLATLSGQESVCKELESNLKLVVDGVKDLGTEKSVRDQLEDFKERCRVAEDGRSTLQLKYDTETDQLREAHHTEQTEKGRLGEILARQVPPYDDISQDFESEKEARRNLQRVIDNQSPTYVKLKEDLARLQQKVEDDDVEKIRTELNAAVAGEPLMNTVLGTVTNTTQRRTDSSKSFGINHHLTTS